MTPPSPFKTAEGESAYLQAYDAALQYWPVPYEEITLPSRFGMTHVVTCGPQDAPPLVLLHGTMTTLLMWLPNIADFCEAYRLYAIDTMGHPSKSIPAEPIRDMAELSEWLGVTLDGLNLDQVFLAGISLGGWIALTFAMSAPQRVRKLVLLSPAASFQPLSTQFSLRAILSAVIPARRMMNAFFAWMGLATGPDDPVTQHLLDVIWLGGQHFRVPPEARRLIGTVFTDEELSSLPLPVLLLIGEDEVIYDPAAALARARRLIPHIAGELVPQSGHAMSYTHHQVVDPLVLEFLRED